MKLTIEETIAKTYDVDEILKVWEEGVAFAEKYKSPTVQVDYNLVKSTITIIRELAKASNEGVQEKSFEPCFESFLRSSYR